MLYWFNVIWILLENLPSENDVYIIPYRIERKGSKSYKVLTFQKVLKMLMSRYVLEIFTKIISQQRVTTIN